jgi:hypothetical protein
VLPALIVVVFVSSQEARAREVDRALHSALGVEATVLLREGTPNEDDVAKEAEREHAQAAAIVTFEADARRTTIRVLRTKTRQWLTREIQFAAADAPEERARTTGFAIAAMLPEEEVEAARKAPPPPPPPPPSSTGPVAPPPAPDQPPPPPLRPARFAADFGATAAVGVGGPAVGVGGVLAIGWRPFGEGIGARVFGSARFGDNSSAQASTRAFSVGAGPTWTTALGPRRRLTLGGSAAFAVLYDQLVHFSGDDPEPVSEGRLLPGVRGEIEGSYRVSEGAGAFVGLGTEIAFGKTDVYVHQARATTVPALRLLGTAGFRLSF